MSQLAFLGFHQASSLICIFSHTWFIIQVLWVPVSCALFLLALKILTALCRGPAITVVTNVNILLWGLVLASFQPFQALSPGKRTAFLKVILFWPKWSVRRAGEAVTHFQQRCLQMWNNEVPNWQKCFQFYLWISGLLLVPHLCLQPAADEAFREAAVAGISACSALEPITEAPQCHAGECAASDTDHYSHLTCSSLGTVFAWYFSWSKWLQCGKELNKQHAVCICAIYCVCIIWASKLSV